MRSRFFTLLLIAIFAIAFTAGGFFAGLLPLWKAAKSAAVAKSRVAVSANIVRVAQDRGSKGTLGTRVTYSYEYNKTRYASEQISAHVSVHSRDNIGDWQQTWYARLSRAKEQNASVTAWVNPDHPADAVLDNEVRWGMVWFAIPFATLFTGVGLAAKLLFIKLISSKDTQWTINSGKKISIYRNQRATGGAKLIASIVFGSVFCLFGVPILMMGVSSKSIELAHVVGSIFTLSGLWIIGSAIYSWIQSKRSTALTLTTFPPHPKFGESFRVEISCANLAEQKMPPAIAVALRQTVWNLGSSSPGGQLHAHRSFIAKRVQIVPNARDVVYEVIVEPPPGARPSGVIRDFFDYRWTIEIAPANGVMAASFPIELPRRPIAAAMAEPMKKTAAPALRENVSAEQIPSQPTDDRFESAYRALSNEPDYALSSLLSSDFCQITHGDREFRVDFPVRGVTRGSAFWMLIAAALFAWHVYASLRAPQIGDPSGQVLAALCGILIVVGVVHYATLKFPFALSPAGLVAQRESFFANHQLFIPLKRVTRFQSWLRHSTETVSQPARDYCSIRVVEGIERKHHVISPTTQSMVTVEALAVELNDVLAVLKQFDSSGSSANRSTKPSLYSSKLRDGMRLVLLLCIVLLFVTDYLFNR